MKADSLEAVIFDMDGVLLDSQGLATQAWTRAVTSLGYRLTEEVSLGLLGRNASDSDAILRQTLGPEFPVEVARRAARTLFAELTAEKGIALKHGVRPLLDFLEVNGVRKAVATSTPRVACIRHLWNCDLLRRFPVIVCGDEVAAGKPAPDIFLLAARLLQVDPASCVVLEDSFAGIQAAHAAGMTPIMVPDLKPPDETIRELAYRVVATLDEAREVIARMI